MNGTVYLVLAYAAALLLIGGYLIYLVREAASLRARLDPVRTARRSEHVKENPRQPEDR